MDDGWKINFLRACGAPDGPSATQVLKKKGLEIGVSLGFSKPKIHRLGRLFEGLRLA
jgi:hypothetical protein